MARTTPRVEEGTLVAESHGAAAIAVGTPAWYAWLEQATTFAFVGVQGRFTARKDSVLFGRMRRAFVFCARVSEWKWVEE